MSTTANVNQLLDELARSRFFGTLEIKLEAGLVVLLRKTETLKLSTTKSFPEHCRDNRGDKNVLRRKELY